MTLVAALKTEACRLGFDLVGVTTPEPPPHFLVYQRWLAAGLHGEMGYLASEHACRRRADPRLILPECQSILVLGTRYPLVASPPGEEIAVAGRGRASGKIAAYACGPDYHDLFPPRLQALVAWLESQVGHPIRNRWYTDTGPLLERDLAQRAGLGWIGKNTCLISPQLGSFFLLAEILLELELDPDPPFLPDRCGTCTRCLEACPTGCIRPDRTIDARRCISYLTIELKGAIPPDLRPLLGEWVFGCDICQQVCPWNQSRPLPQTRLIPDLRAELALTPAEFTRRFQDAPQQRAKRRGYLRNVAVALGNAHDTAAVPALAQALHDEMEPLVRGHAAWALGQIGGRAAQQALQAGVQVETDAFVCLEIQAAVHNLAA